MSNQEGGSPAASLEAQVAEKLQAWAESLRADGAARISVSHHWDRDSEHPCTIALQVEILGQDFGAVGCGTSFVVAGDLALASLARRLLAAQEASAS